MEPNKVWPKRHPTRCFYVRATSAGEAIERVTLRLGDLEGATAWSAEPEEPPFPIVAGEVRNMDGNEVRRVAI